MKAEAVIKQLQSVLPQLTDMFSEFITISSISAVGTTATVITSSPHGESIGDSIAISGTTAPIAITSLDRVDEIATVVTTTNHDLTKGFFETVTLSNFNESEFNGTFKLLDVINRKTFDIEVVDSGPITGTGSALLQSPGEPKGYNGIFLIDSIVDPSTFTYILPRPLAIPGNGLGLVHTGLRITGAVTTERAERMYTSQIDNDDLWAFVILDTVSASKDRHTRDDAVTATAPAGDRRQQMIQQISVVVFKKASDDLSARAVRDSMEDVSIYLFKALLGVKFETGLYETQQLGLVFVSHGLEAYDTSLYIHSFNFELLTNINTQDTVAPDFNVAFRDINFDMTLKLGTEKDPLTAHIDLDREPLP